MDVKLNINGAEVIVPEQTITEAIGKGELTIQNEEIKVFKKPDFDAYVSNVKKEDYENGKRAGIEMEIKAAREKYGLQFEGKTLDNFADSLTGKLKAEFGKEPDKRVQELTNDLASLRLINQSLETKYNGLESTIQQDKITAKKNGLIIGAMPKDNLSIPAEDLAIIFKNRYELDFDEAGNPVVKKDGQILKSQTTLSPLGVSDVVNEFVKPYIKQQQNGGRGEGNQTPATATAMDAFIKEMEGKGFKPGSSAFNTEMSKRIADKTLQYK